jgi:hypothetical protein
MGWKIATIVTGVVLVVAIACGVWQIESEHTEIGVLQKQASSSLAITKALSTRLDTASALLNKTQARISVLYSAFTPTVTSGLESLAGDISSLSNSVGALQSWVGCVRNNESAAWTSFYC